MIYSEHTTGCVLNAEDYLTPEEFMVMAIGLAYMNGFDVDIVELSKTFELLSDAEDDETIEGLGKELDDMFNKAIWFLEDDAPEGFEWRLEGKALYLDKIW